MLRLEVPPARMDDWAKFVERVVRPRKRVSIAVVGKYIELQDAYKSIYESLTHAGAAHDCGIDLVLVDAENLGAEGGPQRHLRGVAGILVPGGFGDRGIEGKIAAARFARETGTPYLGICLGMQVAVVEFARHVCAHPKANSTEFDPETPDPVIYLMAEQKDVTDKGATMRLGSYPCTLRKNTLVHQLYGSTEIEERHRHRYEFNMKYREEMEKAGLVLSGTSPDDTLAEVVELRSHPWFVACQFHPEFRSRPREPHPLFKGFVGASLTHVS
jgi:CTP synthase